MSEGDGTYALVDLPTDDYYVVASLDGYGREYYLNAPDIASATEVSVTVPITTPNISFTLSAGGAISGHVFAVDGGAPVEGAMVWTEPAGGGLPAVTSAGGDGAYTVDDLATGSYDGWAGHGSYLADVKDAAIVVSQPDTTGDVDFALPGPHFPLRNVGDGYNYTWSNDVRHPGPIQERWQIVGEDWGGRSGFAISAQSEMTESDLWFQDGGDGVGLNDWSVWDRSSGLFPNFMVGVGTHMIAPYQVMKQPLVVGANWSGSGWEGSMAASTVLADDEVVLVAAGTFSDVLHIHTIITGNDGLSTVLSVSDGASLAAGDYTDLLRSHTEINGTSTYLSGERDMWFAPGVGLIKLVYHHDDGSTTTAELVGGPYTNRVFLPIVLKNPVLGPPMIASTSPPDGATGVRRDLPAVHITFNKEMQNSWSVNLGGIGDVDISLDSTSKTFILTRTSADLLAPNTKHTLTINPPGHGLWFRDLAGTPAPTTSFSFTTGN